MKVCQKMVFLIRGRERKRMQVRIMFSFKVTGRNACCLLFFPYKTVIRSTENNLGMSIPPLTVLGSTTMKTSHNYSLSHQTPKMHVL